MRSWMFLLTACSAFAASEPAGETCSHDGPVAHEQVELGRVAWIREADEARALARRSGKPIFVQFDEVPGCHTVQSYGREVLSDPVVLEALHHLTVPLLVRNNVDGGWERELLDRFGEPSWNNPVSRLVDADLEPLGPRQTGLQTADVLGSIRSALGDQAPPWLVLLADERSGVELSEATFATACFWDGEADLGALDGIVATETGFQGGREVVRVTYRADRISGSDLQTHARREGHRPADPGSFRSSAKDDRYHLKHSPWAKVPMSPAQQSKVNAAIRDGKDPRPWLTPAQVALVDG